MPRYAGLGDYLRKQTASEIRLRLNEIAELVGNLPKDAWTHQFWANAADYHISRRNQWLKNGYRAFYEPQSESVRFERQDSAPEAGQSWSTAELEACVRAYREMVLLQEAVQKANKTEFRRRVLPLLQGRSEGSYEFRMQNISAVLDELGLPILSGYLPRKNVGNVKEEIIRLINLHWHRTAPEAVTDDPDRLDTRVVSARQILARNPAVVPKGRKVPQRSARESSAFVRDPNVIGWVLNIAKGICELCDHPAPFRRKDGEPYLEVHHLRQLAEGGPDQVDNALALCPNCHRHFHHGHDRQSLRKRALQKIRRLFDYPVLRTAPNIADL